MTQVERDKRIVLTVRLEVTPAQCLTLAAMFEYWNSLGRNGASRYVAFFCDGDGNFRPAAAMTTDRPDNWPLPLLTDELREKAIRSDTNGDRKYDFDQVAWVIRAD